MQDECKLYMDSYMSLNGSCFMVTCIIFKNHLLEVHSIQNEETMTLQMLTIIDLSYFIMRVDSHEWHLVESLVTYDFTLCSSIRDHTT